MPGTPQKSQERAVTAIRPEIGSSGSDGWMAGFFKKAGLKKESGQPATISGRPDFGPNRGNRARFQRRLGRAGRSPVLATRNGPLSTDSRQKLAPRPTC